MVTNLNIDSTSNETIVLSWIDDSTSSFYSLERSIDSTTYINISFPIIKNYSDTNITPGIEYFYRVSSFDGTSFSEFSNIVSGTTDLNPPTSLTIGHISSSSILLNWLDNSNKETGFDLQRSTDGTNFTSISILPPNTISYIDSTGISQSTTYFYKIADFNSIIYSSFSNIVSGTTSESIGSNIKDRTPEFGAWLGHPLFSESYLYNKKCIVKNDSFYVDYSVSNVFAVECNIDFSDTTSNGKITLVHAISKNSFNNVMNLTTYIPDCYWLLIDSSNNKISLYFNNILLSYTYVSDINGKYRIRTFENTVIVEKGVDIIIGPLNYELPNDLGYGGFFSTCKDLLLDNFKIFGRYVFIPTMIGKQYIFEDIIFINRIEFLNGTFLLTGSSADSRLCFMEMDNEYNVESIRISDSTGISPSSILLSGSNTAFIGGETLVGTEAKNAIVKMNTGVNFQFLEGKYIDGIGGTDEITSIIDNTSDIYISVLNKIISFDSSLNLITTKKITDYTDDTYISDMKFIDPYYHIIGGYSDGTSVEQAFILRLNSDLSFVDSKLIGVNNDIGKYIYLEEIKEYQNKIYLLGGISDSTSDLSINGLVLRLDLDLNIIDNKVFNDSLGLFEEIFLTDIFLEGTDIYINGIVSYLNNINGSKVAVFWKMITLKLDNNLDIVYSKMSYASNNMSNEAFTQTLFDQANNRILLHGEITDPSFTFQQHYFIATNPNVEFRGIFTSDDNTLNMDDYILDSTSFDIITSDSTSIIISDSTCNISDFTLTFSSNNSFVKKDMYTITGKARTISNVHITQKSATSILLEWSFPNIPEEEGFYIERSMDGTNFTIIDYVSINSRRYFDDTLSPLTTYYYRVKSYNISSMSNPSSKVSVTTIDTPSGLLTPENLILTNKELNTVQNIELTWDDLATSENGYYVERKLGITGTYERIKTLPSNTQKYFDPSLNIATQYFYRVQCFDSTSESSFIESSVITRSSFNISKSPNNIYRRQWTNGLYFYNTDNFIASKLMQSGEIIDIPLEFDLFPMTINLPDNSNINIVLECRLFASESNSIFENTNPQLTRFGGGVGYYPKNGSSVETYSTFSYIYGGTLDNWHASGIIIPSDFRSNNVGAFVSFINNSVNDVTLNIDGFTMSINWDVPITY